MKNSNNPFGTLFHPKAAILLYHGGAAKDKLYVESYQIDADGCPVNGHPLTIREAGALAKALDVSGELSNHFLKAKGLLPSNILHIAPGQDGYALWHTRETKIPLCFTSGLGLQDGTYPVPALIWKATKTHLQVFALKTGEKPNLETALYHAPFFNIYEQGRVCMGSVDIHVPQDTYLEDFIQRWQLYFFGSKFSHLIGRKSPVKGNVIAHFQELYNSDRKFPAAKLLKSSFTLKNLIQ